MKRVKIQSCNNEAVEAFVCSRCDKSYYDVVDAVFCEDNFCPSDEDIMNMLEEDLFFPGDKILLRNIKDKIRSKNK